MDRFVEMQTFCAVVDAGSFVGAAEALGLSKATTSRYVGELETRLGVRLLHRTTRRLSLTEDGERFYARSREVLAGLEEAEAELHSRSGAARGLLRINAPVTFGIRHLAPLWGAFRDLHPQVRLEVTLADRTVDLVEEGFDIAIRIAALRCSLLDRSSVPWARVRSDNCCSRAVASASLASPARWMALMASAHCSCHCASCVPLADTAASACFIATSAFARLLALTCR